MGHTKEEAASLWCPMVRMVQIGVSESNNSYNRILLKTHKSMVLRDEDGEEKRATMLEVQPQIPIAAVCISDQCAMWQWIPSKTTHKVLHVEEMPNGDRRTVNKDVPDDPTHGFCGLARGVQS